MRVPAVPTVAQFVQLGVCSGTVILRSDNANAPIPPLRVLSFRYHFAADVYHIVRYAFAVEQTRDYVTDSTAAEHREIEQDAGIVFHHTVACKRTFRKLQSGGYCLRVAE